MRRRRFFKIAAQFVCGCALAVGLYKERVSTITVPGKAVATTTRIPVEHTLHAYVKSEERRIMWCGYARDKYGRLEPSKLIITKHENRALGEAFSEIFRMDGRT